MIEDPMAEEQVIVKPSKYPVIPEYDQDIAFANLDDAINTYVATRDALSEERKAYNTYEAKAKNYLERIEGFIMQEADKLGLESVRGKSGTAYRVVKVQYRVSNWDEYWAWLKENDFSQCVEKRAAKLAVKEIHDETGVVPPGLEYVVEVGFDIRRPTR